MVLKSSILNDKLNTKIYIIPTEDNALVEVFYTSYEKFVANCYEIVKLMMSYLVGL